MPDIDLLEEYVRFRSHPLKFLSSSYRLLAGSGFAAYRGYAGTPIYTENPHFNRELKELALHQPQLSAEVETLVNSEVRREISLLGLTDLEKRSEECREQIRRKLEQIAVKALPTFTSKTAVRLLYLFFSQVLSRAYPGGLHLDRAQVERLRVKARELADRKQSIVLLPSHKSHLDYIVLVYTFFYLNLSLPLTMAGDNLDIPVIARFLRQVGGTFMRRGNWKDDRLYSAFFQSLVTSILQQGYNLQVFIEGTRSRTGKLLPPRFGLLSFIYEAVASGNVEDCYIVPVSVQYDKVIEADSYASELLGREKQPENLKSFFEARSVLQMNLGRIDVQISEGFSLKDFIAKQSAVRTVACRALAYRVLSDINTVSIVMPSDLVGTALLTTRQRGLSISDLVARVQLLIRRVIEHGGRIGALPKHVADLSTDDVTIMVRNAIEVLKPDVAMRSGQLLEPVCSAQDEFKLSYYRNRLVHLFVDEALVCTCLYQHFTQTLSLEIPMDQLTRKVEFLSLLLSSEFVFDADRDFPTAMQRALQRLQLENVIAEVTEKSVVINAEELRTNWGHTHFYCLFVWPFIDGYWSTLLTLQILPLNRPFSIKKFLKVAQVVANTLYSEGALAHVEASNREIILSALAQSELRGLIKRGKTHLEVLVDLEKSSQKLGSYRNEVKERPGGEDLLKRIDVLAKALAAKL